MTKLAVLLALALSTTAGAQGVAQTGSQTGYPNVNRPLAIGPGDTIQVLNRTVIDRSPGARAIRLDLQYSTRIPASDVTARLAQADRVAQTLSADAKSIGARVVSISICETQACAEMREQPKTWYIYERGVGGVWFRRP
jgi:hypothetical protein